MYAKETYMYLSDRSIQKRPTYQTKETNPPDTDVCKKDLRVPKDKRDADICKRDLPTVKRDSGVCKEIQMCAKETYMYRSDKRDSNVFKRDVQRRQKRPFHQTEVSQMYAKETHCVEKRDPLTR